MRCYFMRDGHIQVVEILSATDDPGRIAQAHELFESKGKPRFADGFEVWEGSRFIYRWPEPSQSLPSAG